MRIRKNEVLFEKGQLESGGKFHILLDGKLALYTQPLSEMLNIEIGPENKREGILAQYWQQIPGGKRILTPFSLAILRHREERQSNIKIVNNGQCFGEMALLFDRTAHECTCTALEDSTVAVLPKRLFGALFKASERERLNAHMQFYYTHPLFE